MLDPQKAGAIWQEHFDTVTDEEFVARVKRVSPDMAQELWGDRSVAEICGAARVPAAAQRAPDAGRLHPLRHGLRRLLASFRRSPA